LGVLKVPVMVKSAFEAWALLPAGNMLKHLKILVIKACSAFV